MNKSISLKNLLSEPGSTLERQLSLFAIISLGVLESLSNGLMTATDSVRYFFNAENCLFVHQTLGKTIAEEVMSHGIQLPDLFDALPTEKAQREFNRELATIRSLCLKLLSEERVAA
ncbi:MAG: hypothetical protein JNK38_24025 [Acidobacteria bacterium]|nr:hypothetical protein [Acidobacteriota bacterium]